MRGVWARVGPERIDGVGDHPVDAHRAQRRGAREGADEDADRGDGTVSACVPAQPNPHTTKRARAIVRIEEHLRERDDVTRIGPARTPRSALHRGMGRTMTRVPPTIPRWGYLSAWGWG